MVRDALDVAPSRDDGVAAHGAVVALDRSERALDVELRAADRADVALAERRFDTFPMMLLQIIAL